MNQYVLVFPEYFTKFINIYDIYNKLKIYHPATAVIGMDTSCYQIYGIQIPVIFTSDNKIYMRLKYTQDDINCIVDPISKKACIDLINGIVWDFGFSLNTGEYITTHGDIKKCSLTEMENAYLMSNINI
jgi:hypothetical protein